jgi:hypothetical protein
MHIGEARKSTFSLVDRALFEAEVVTGVLLYHRSRSEAHPSDREQGALKSASAAWK